MARLPIDVEMRGGRTLRERIWDAMVSKMRKAGKFTVAEISTDAHPASEDSINEYLHALETAGYALVLKAQGRRPSKKFTAVEWKLTVAFPIAPRVNRAGKPIMSGMKNLAMWRAAKIRKQFKPSELARDATLGPIVVSLETAKAYCSALAKSGHFRMNSKGKGGIESVYTLVKDTGPHAPCITRAKVVFDRNIGMIAVAQSTEEVTRETAA